MNVINWPYLLYDSGCNEWFNHLVGVALIDRQLIAQLPRLLARKHISASCSCSRENTPTNVIIGLAPQEVDSWLVTHLDYHCLCCLGICMLHSQQARESTPTPELNISRSKGPLLLDWVSLDEIKLTRLIGNYNEEPEKCCQWLMPPQISNSIVVPAMAIQAPRFPPYKPRINPYKWRALAHTSAKRKPITEGRPL